MRKQRKKNKQRSFKLEEDDYDLIEDNLNVPVKRRKRLQRQAEREDKDQAQEEDNTRLNHTQRLKREASDAYTE